MGLDTKDHFWTIGGRGRENTPGPIETAMKASGERIECTEKEGSKYQTAYILVRQSDAILLLFRWIQR